MNFNNLQYFLVTAEEKNITRAARRLHVSQQSLSSQIRRLEKELGTALFVRDKELILTPAGECLQQEAHIILADYQRLLKEIDALKGYRQEQLRIGVSYAHASAIINQLLKKFQAEHPFVEMNVTTSSSSALEQALDKDQLDLIFLLLPSSLNDVEITVISREPMWIAVPEPILAKHFGSAWQKKKEELSKGVKLAVFKGEAFILHGRRERQEIVREYLLQCFEKAPDVIQTYNRQTALQISAQGKGIAFLPFGQVPERDSQKGNLSFFPLKDEALQDRFALLYKRGAAMSPAAQALVSEVQKTAFQNNKK